MIINLPPHIQLLCMSATVRNPDDLGGWISQVHGECETIRTSFRPVPLTWHFCHSGTPAGGGAPPPARLLPLLENGGRRINPALLPPAKRYSGDDNSSGWWVMGSRREWRGGGGGEEVRGDDAQLVRRWQAGKGWCRDAAQRGAFEPRHVRAPCPRLAQKPSGAGGTG